MRIDFYEMSGRFSDPVEVAGVLVGKAFPATSDIASALTEKYYPVHAAKVGGIGWRLFMSFAGLALAMLGLFASWSFWAGRGRAPRRSRS